LAGVKRAISSILAVAFVLSLLAAPAQGAAQPGSKRIGAEVRRAVATASGWRRKCNRKPTRHKRRACKRRHLHHAAQQADRTYSGQMLTTVDYYDACRTYLGRTTNNINVSVVVGPPLRPTAQGPDVPPAVGTENNPIHLFVGEPTVSEQTVAGSISLASAERFNGTSPNVILQYWQLALSGSALSGTLVQDHREESAAYNLLAAPEELVGCQPQYGFYPNQYAIAEGSKLSGTITDSAVQLQISGNVVQGTRPFAASLTANRVN
jgi:Ni/Co efflux regulator RcnB